MNEPKREGTADSNPWQATTLEWTAAPSPPIAHGNFEDVPNLKIWKNWENM